MTQDHAEKEHPKSTAELEQKVRELSAQLDAAKQTQAKLAYDALHDPLTLLPNRSLFMEHLERMLYYAERHADSSVAVLFVDIDAFKAINDNLGHAGGDDVLMTIAARIKGVLRHSDVVARLGGDEFVIALDGLPGLNEAEHIARRLLEEIRAPVSVQGVEFVVTVSIGIATVRPDHATSRDLVHDADIAMYKAKESGGDRYFTFEPSMALAMLRVPSLEAPLRRAMDRDELELHYQEIHSLADGRPVGCEALLRWRDGSDIRMPVEFIHVAEETGLMKQIGRWVMRNACRQIAGDRSKKQGFYVSMNVGSSQFFDAGFLRHVREALSESGLEPTRLVLEITEAVVMDNPILALRLLADLEHLGVRVQIDEFGTRHSILNRVLQMPISALKISRDLIGSIDDRHGTTRVVRAVVNMAHSLNIHVVGEGIETTEQLRSLQELGCDFGQGYYLAAPAPASRLFHS